MVDKAVLEYLKKMNRLYSANDIQNNLKDYGKSMIVKALDSLVCSSRIIEKANDKQKIYYINQDTFGDVEEDEMKDIEKKIKKLHAEFEQLRIDSKMKEGERNQRKYLLTMEEIKSKMVNLTEEIEMLKEKIAKGSQTTVQSNESTRVKDEYIKINKEMRNRKRVTEEAIDLMVEKYEWERADLLKELNIEL